MFLCSCVAACVFINIILFDYADGYQASSIPNQNQCGLFVYNNCELSNCRCLVGRLGQWKMMALIWKCNRVELGMQMYVYGFWS